MGSEYETARFVGYDIHTPSIDDANKEEKGASLGDGLEYKVADAEGYEGEYDIMTFFDYLHDMGDPLGVALYAKSKLSSHGWSILIEPSTSNDVSKNMNPIGQMYYSFLTMGCVPTSKSQK